MVSRRDRKTPKELFLRLHHALSRFHSVSKMANSVLGIWLPVDKKTNILFWVHTDLSRPLEILSEGAHFISHLCFFK